MSSINLMLLQLSDSTELERYLCKCPKDSLVALGEYVLNPFFKDRDVKNIIEGLQEEFLELLANKYEVSILAPLIKVEGQNIYKCIALSRPNESIEFYKQQILMSMDHWNEAKFFSNKNVGREEIVCPPIFTIDGLKISTLFGYEAHFDEFFIKLREEDVDLIVIPSASTFNSSLRWRKVLESRAFLNSCFIARVNRVGSFIDENYLEWIFYGDSFLSNPNGITDSLMLDRNGVLMTKLDKQIIQEHIQEWKFRRSTNE